MKKLTSCAHVLHIPFNLVISLAVLLRTENCTKIYNECVVPLFVLFCDVLVVRCSYSCFTVHSVCRSPAFRCNAPVQIILLALEKFARHKKAIIISEISSQSDKDLPER